MAKFRDVNRFLIYYTNIFGLYMTSIESVTRSKWLIAFFTVWTKIPITILPVYISWDVRSLIFDEMTMLARLAMIRKVFVFCGFFLKNVLFYYQRKKIERLIELWDSSFKENFYPEEELIYIHKNHKKNKTLVKAALLLGIVAAVSYSVPSFFSKKKVFTHPTGLFYPHCSPGYEFAVLFDFWATFSCVSGVAYDSILVTFLSEIRSKLDFLRGMLTKIVNEVVVNDEGVLMGRQLRRIYSSKMEDYYEETEKMSVQFERNMAKVEEKLRIWISHHQQTIHFFDELRMVYSNIATFQLGYTIIYTGLTALNIVKLKFSSGALGVALAATSNLTSLFLWCKLSGGLMDIDPFSEAFSLPWYVYPKKITTAFSFIIMRSNKRLSLNGFSIYKMSLMTFFEILKLTYQFSAFMVHITGKES